MQYWKCKCGKREFYGSGMSPQPCQVCDECGTTMNGSDPIPHDWKPQFSTDDGTPTRPYCRRCYERAPKPE